MRKILYVLGGLVALLIAAAVVAPMVVDVNDYKAEIVAQVKEQTGRDLVIDGPLDLSLLPSPVLSAEGVRFANVAGSSEPDMARIGSLRVSVAALPLLAGRLDVSQVSLVDARIVLETLPDGTANWNFSAAQAKSGAGVAGGGSSQASGTPIAVRDLAIEDSTLIWRDPSAGRSVQLDHINARVRADSLQGPFDVRLAFESRGIPLSAELRTGDLSAGAQPAFVQIETQGGRIVFDGTIAQPTTAPVVKGSLKGTGDSLAALAQVLAAAAGQAPVALPPAFARKFVLESTIDGSADRIAARGVKLTLGADTGEGEVVVVPGEPLRADIRFAFAKLDFDQLLAMPDGKAPTAVQPSAGKAGESRSGPETTLKSIEGSVDLAIGTVVYRGRTAQQVAVRADLSKGVLNLQELGGRFPGNTVIAAAGRVDATAAQPSGGGKLEMRSARLREFLDWLDVDVARVPADRLNALDFTGTISASAEGDVQIANAVAKVDSTTARGTMTLRTAPRLGVVANLDIDTLNVDAYLPAGDPGGASKAGGAEKRSGAPFDATIKARVAQLTYRGTQIEGVDVDATIAGDRLSFRPSRVANLAGANFAWNGTVSDYDGNPTIDLTIDLRTQDADRLLKLAGVASPTRQRLGAVTAQGRIAGRTDDLSFSNFALSALGSSAKITGRLGAQGPTYNFSRFELRSDDADRLLAALGIQSPLAGRKLGAVTIAGAAQGSATQATVDLDVSLQGAALDLKGTASGLDHSPALAMTVGVRHPDFQRFMRLLQPEYGGGVGVGAIAFTAKVDGSPDRELRITNLRGNLGGASISGNVVANLAGAVPDVAISLETGALEIDRILPLGQRAGLAPDLRQYPPGVVPVSGGTQLAQATGRAGKFSRSPIDVSSLRSVNGRLDLRSQALSMQPWRIEDAVGQLELRGGVLSVKQLAGRAFDGEFTLTGNLDAAQLPARMSASLRAVQIDMGRLSRALAQKDRFDGRMTVSLDLAGNGSSEADLVSSLDGGGSLNGKIRLNTSFSETAGGIIAGQAAKQVDKLLGSLLGNKNASIGGGDLNAAINVVLARFANRDGDASGTLSVRNGVIRSSDLRVTGTRARAETTMTANLPAWTLDATTNVILDENPGQPYLIVINRGPLDDPNISISRGQGRASDEPTQQQQAPAQSQPGQLQPDQQPAQQDQPAKKKKPSFKDLLKKF